MSGCRAPTPTASRLPLHRAYNFRLAPVENESSVFQTPDRCDLPLNPRPQSQLRDRVQWQIASPSALESEWLEAEKRAYSFPPMLGWDGPSTRRSIRSGSARPSFFSQQGQPDLWRVARLVQNLSTHRREVSRTRRCAQTCCRY